MFPLVTGSRLPESNRGPTHYEFAYRVYVISHRSISVQVKAANHTPANYCGLAGTVPGIVPMTESAR